jgi:hypothetical protein
VVEAFVCMHSASCHLIMLARGCVKLREWLAEGLGCGYFNGFITEVGSDAYPTSPVECSSSSVSRS